MVRRTFSPLIAAVMSAAMLLVAVIAVNLFRPVAGTPVQTVWASDEAKVTITSTAQFAPVPLGKPIHFHITTNVSNEVQFAGYGRPEGADAPIFNLGSKTGTGQASLDYAFPGPGTYIVTATVAPNGGGVTTTSEPIKVKVLEPKIDLRREPDHVLVNKPVTWTVTLRQIDPNLAGDVLLQYGDGTEQIVSTPDNTLVVSGTHAYSLAGVYQVTATLLADSTYYGGAYGSELAMTHATVRVFGVNEPPTQTLHLDVDPSTVLLPADGSTTRQVKATVTENGQPVQGAIVHFTFALAAASANEATNQQGRAFFTVPARSSEAEGDLLVSTGDITRVVPVHYIAPSGVPFTITVSADKEAIRADGHDHTKIRVTVLDAQGNPVKDYPVQLSTSAGTLDETSATTKGNGRADFELTAANHPVIAVLTGTVTTSAGDITNHTKVSMGYRLSFLRHLLRHILHELDLPQPGRSFFRHIRVQLPPDVIDKHEDENEDGYDLDYREILSPSIGLHNGISSTLEFDLKLRKPGTEDAFQITKPITIIIDIDRDLLRQNGLLFETLFFERIVGDQTETQGITIHRDAANSQLIIVVNHLSTFRLTAAPKILTYLPVQRRT